MPEQTDQEKETVTVTVDGQPVEATPGELVIAVTDRHGVYVPRFCYHPRMRPVAMCRMCLVEVKTPKGFMLQPACYVPVTPDMEVVTTSARVKKAQDGVLEFLLINHPLDCPVCDKGGECPLQDQTLAYGPSESRFVEEKRHFAKPIPLSSLVDIDRERCIQCDRCTRFAEEVAGDPLIEFVGRSDQLEINTFPDHPFSSYFSGNTVQICPVGALLARPYRFRARPWDLEQVESTCTSCAFGCRVAVQSSSNALTRYLGIDSDPVNHGWLCDMGRFDFEAINSDQRLGHPLVRKPGGEGEGDELVEASWGEALQAAAAGLDRARSVHGADAVAVLGGARLPNEDAYAWAKLAKTVIGTDNVDAQLGDGLPAEAVLGLPRASIDEACTAPAVVLLSGDIKEELPVLYLRLRAAAVNRDMPIVELAPQRSGMSRYCKATLTYRPGEAGALARALVEGAKSDVAGVDAESVNRAGELLEEGAVVVLGRPSVAESAASITAAAAALATLPGVRFLPALRRANVMGALDMGLAPGVLPGRVSLDEGREWFSQEWGVIPEERGHDATAILSAAAEGRVQGLVLLGSDPVSDFPDRQLARRALSGAGFVVAVDTFLTPSSRQADVVLPAAGYAERPGTTTNIEGRVTRLAQKVVPPGVAWPDWMIAVELAARMGGDLGAESVEDLWDEVERLAPSHAGVTRAVLADRRSRDGVVPPLTDGYPGAVGPSPAASTDTNIGATDEEAGGLDPMAWPGVGETESQGVPATQLAPTRRAGLPEPGAEEDGGEGTSEGSGPRRPPLLSFSGGDAYSAPPVDSYSLRLVAHRQLYGQGTLVQRSPSLAGLAPTVKARLNPYELDRLGVAPGSRLRVRSRKAEVVLEVGPDAGVPRGCISVPFNAVGTGAGELIDAGQPVVDVRVETL